MAAQGVHALQKVHPITENIFVGGEFTLFRPGESGLFKCHDWILNSHHNTITRGETIHHLTHRLTAMLLYLGQRSGGVVGREELLKALWGRRIVGDDSLAVAVSQLRKALGDDSKSPTYIKTIPRVGYLFLQRLYRL